MKKMRPRRMSLGLTTWIFAVLLLAALPIRADRLLTVGFEENNLSQTMWTGITGSPSIVTTPVHSGTYALHCLAQNTFVRKDLVANKTSGTAWTRFEFRTADTPGALRRIHDVRNSSGGSNYILQINTDRTLRLQNIVTSTTADSSTALTVDTWHRIEVRHLISDTVGELELFIDGTSEASITGEDTLSTNVSRYQFGRTASDGGNQNFYWDDIAINDEAGTFQNGLPGDGKIFLIEPSGDNTVTWTKDGSSPAATNWEGVDDLPGAPDDGTTYNSATTNITDKLDLSNLGAEVPSDADIILVDVYGRQGSNGTTGARRITYELWDQADSQTTGPLVSCAINGWRIADTDEHLVFDPGSRSKSNIDSFRVGYQRNHGGGNEERITAQWVNVEWIESTGDDDLMVIQ